jgi:hypothetical protein
VCLVVHAINCDDDAELFSLSGVNLSELSSPNLVHFCYFLKRDINLLILHDNLLVIAFFIGKGRANVTSTKV